MFVQRVNVISELLGFSSSPLK